MGAADFEASAKQPFGWRGDGSGRFPDATPPIERTATNLRWSATVGSSNSSPCLSGKYIFVASEPNLLVCVDCSDGRERWRAATNAADLQDEQSRKKAAEYELPKDGAGMMAATPVTDGHFVYVVFSNGVVRAFDMDGKPQWVSYIDSEQITGYGRSASPILVDGKLIVHMTALFAFDASTGKQVWVNTEAKSTYGTPIEMTLGGTRVVVTPDGDVVRADTGKTVKTGIGSCANASPVSDADVVYFVERQVNAVRMDDAFKGTELWTADIRRQLFGSPIIHNGMVFTATSQAELLAYNAGAKGEQEPFIDARPLLDGGGEANSIFVFASLSLAGKYIFLNTTRAELVVLEATREAKVASRIKLTTGSNSAPVFLGKRMFLRDGDKLLCIGE